MVVIRNQLASVASGGPRQFAELREKILIRVSEGSEQEVVSQLDSQRLSASTFRNAPIISAEPQDRIEEVLDNLQERTSDVSAAINEINRARQQEDGVVESTTAMIRSTDQLLREIQDLNPVESASFVHSYADFGPENLRLDITDLPTVQDSSQPQNTQQDVIEALNIPDVWEVTRGENARVAIFDTGYAEGIIDEGRIEATFNSGGTDSVYESAEGHGTMCAGAAAANSNEEVPFDGVAPDSRVYLIRITGEDGQIRSDIISEGWDWLLDQVQDVPIVTNHSYGTPICSTFRRPQVCNTPAAEFVKIANSSPFITSCYAAGNEAMYCGHRLSGVTNGITGANSLEDLVTVGALLSNGRDAQRYSSHGRGDCAPRADPKPNCSYRIPMRCYYGAEEGWKIKDMATGVWGSGGGTSCASPMTSGALALVQSAAMNGNLPDYDIGPLQVEEIKQVIKDNSDPPRATQVNQFGFVSGPSGWDARFGYGQFKVDRAIIGE